MNAEEKRSHRLNTLLRKAQSGSSYLDLENQCRAWGLSDPTVRSYMNAIVAKTRKS